MSHFHCFLAIKTLNTALKSNQITVMILLLFLARMECIQ